MAPFAEPLARAYRLGKGVREGKEWERVEGLQEHSEGDAGGGCVCDGVEEEDHQRRAGRRRYGIEGRMEERE